MLAGTELLVDLSQFVSSPARSGVQRVLVELIRKWPLNVVSAEIGYLDETGYSIVPFEEATALLQNHFDDRNGATSEQAAADLKAELDQAVIAKGPVDEIAYQHSAYLLPELTYHDNRLDILRKWGSERPQRTFAIFYDALPQTNPEVFRERHQMLTSRYYRELAKIENVACISRASLDCLVGRLRRRPASNAVVVQLGTDAFRLRPAGDELVTREFVMVGTIELRKNHEVVLAAFSQLWWSGFNDRLHFIGAPGLHADSFLKKLLDRQAADPVHFRWTQGAADVDVRTALAESLAAIFVSEAEGYGLPAAEALAAGCPLIAAASLPALEGLPTNGQIRLDDVSVKSVKAAVQSAASWDVNRRLRRELTHLHLPTWQDFAHRLVGSNSADLRWQ